MNPEIKKRWVEALRSGKYEQGRGQLRNADNKYCCLGVLCDLYSQELNVPWSSKIIDVDDIPNTVPTFMGCNGSLPPLVCSWAGITSRRGGSVKFAPVATTLSLRDEMLDLPSINDLKEPFEVGFDVIANLIEEQL